MLKHVFKAEICEICVLTFYQLLHFQSVYKEINKNRINQSENSYNVYLYGSQLTIDPTFSACHRAVARYSVLVFDLLKNVQVPNYILSHIIAKKYCKYYVCCMQ